MSLSGDTSLMSGDGTPARRGVRPRSRPLKPPKPASISIAPTPRTTAAARASPARRMMSTAPSPEGGIQTAAPMVSAGPGTRSRVFSSTAVAQRLRMALVEVGVGAGQEHRDLGVAPARDDVVLAARGAELFPDTAEEVVADAAGAGGLETFDAEADDRVGQPGALGAAVLAIGVALEGAAVGEAARLVDGGDLLEAAREGLALFFGVALAGHVAEHVDAADAASAVHHRDAAPDDRARVGSLDLGSGRPRCWRRPRLRHVAQPPPSRRRRSPRRSVGQSRRGRVPPTRAARAHRARRRGGRRGGSGTLRRRRARLRRARRAARGGRARPRNWRPS